MVTKNGKVIASYRLLEFYIFRFLDKLVQVARLDKLEELGWRVLDVRCWM